MSYTVRDRRIVTTGLEEAFNEARASGMQKQSSFVRGHPVSNSPSESRDIPPVHLTRAMLNKARVASADITRIGPSYTDPRYSASTLQVPTDVRQLNGLYRFYDQTDPIIGVSNRLHTEIPLSDILLSETGDAAVQPHFEEMWERIQGPLLLMDIGHEFWALGNAIIYGSWNSADYMWDQFACLNPDFVEIQSTWVTERKPFIMLIPDEGLKKLVSTQSPRYLYDQLPPMIIDYVRVNQKIPLDPNNVFHIAHSRAPYETLGYPPQRRLLKILLYESRLMDAQYAIATRHVVPVTVVKVGDPNTGWLPHQSEIDDVRELFSAFELDPNFTIFYHWGLNVEFYGANGQILPVGPEFERIQKLKFIGMGISDALMTGAAGTYSTAYANLEILRQRYLNFQLKLRLFVAEIFRAAAHACGFYKTSSLTSGYGYIGRKYGGAQAHNPPSASFGDYDNEDYVEFMRTESARMEKFASRVEYVHPNLTFGALSAASDSAFRQWLLSLKKENPFSVSWGTIQKVSRLDADQELRMAEGEMRDIHKRITELAKQGITIPEPGVLTAGGGMPFSPPVPDLDLPLPVGGAAGEGTDFGGGEPVNPPGQALTSHRTQDSVESEFLTALSRDNRRMRVENTVMGKALIG